MKGWWSIAVLVGQVRAHMHESWHGIISEEKSAKQIFWLIGPQDGSQSSQAKVKLSGQGKAYSFKFTPKNW
jgi:hypothetical protein